MTNAPTFQKATRHAVKARIALAGPSGSGKTYTALMLAIELAQATGGRVACIDTEKGSASLYADEFDFDTLTLDPPFSPARYAQAIEAAVEAGYVVAVVDSLSHAWSDEGGVLDIVDQEAARTKGNKFAAWRKGTPEQQRLVNAILRAPIHVVVTMRSKQEYTLDVDDKGRKQVRKLGLAPIQREGIEYEFSLFGELDLDHTLSISKSRFKALQDLVVRKPGTDFAQLVLAELDAGETSGASGAVGQGPTQSPTRAEAATAEEASAAPEQVADGMVAGEIPARELRPHETPSPTAPETSEAAHAEATGEVVSKGGGSMGGSPTPPASESPPGPKGDGVTDDTAALQAGRTAEESGSFPPVSDPGSSAPSTKAQHVRIVEFYGGPVKATKTAREKFGVNSLKALTESQAADLIKARVK